jgi:hypothetical protein
MHEDDLIHEDEFDFEIDPDEHPARPELENFGLRRSDLAQISDEMARLTEASRPFMPHSVEYLDSAWPIVVLVASCVPSYLAGGLGVAIAGLASAVVVGGVTLWAIDGGYRRFGASRHARPDLSEKVAAFREYERCLYEWRISRCKSFPLSLDRRQDEWVRCWWNRRNAPIPSPSSYGAIRNSPLQNWQLWDLLDGKQQNVVRFLYWRTRSRRLEFAVIVVLTVGLAALLIAVIGFRSP